TVTRDIIVADRSAPLITITGSTTVNHEQGTLYTDAGATASDVIDGDISANIVTSGTVDVNTAGTYSINYNVSDATGNAATQLTRTVIVSDTTIPVITLNSTNPLDHEVGTIFVDPGATASDNTDGDISTAIGVTGTVDANTQGAYTLTYNVSDSSGNAAATVVRTANVVDTGVPSIALIGDNPVLHELQTPYTDAGATASDAADGDLSASITVTGSVDPDIAGTYTLSYDANDSQSNAATTVTRDVIVADRTAPVITITGGSTVNAEQGTVYSDAGATATDIIDGDISVNIITTGAVDTNTAGNYTIHYNVSDAAGNPAIQASRTVIVSDTTAPLITLAGANPLDHEVGTIFVDPGASASDNIDGDISLSIGVTGTVDANTQGTYTLTYNVSDSSGNAAATTTRTVNVVDTGAPTITLNGDNPTLHELQTTYTDAGATATDAVDGNLSASIIVSGTVDANIAGTYTLSYNVTDLQSNAAPTVTRDVIVADRTGPVITLLGSATVNVEQGATYTDAGATASDAIDGDLSSNIVLGGAVNTSVSGSYTLTYNVSDASGNAATQVSRTVIVSDMTAPVISLVGTDPLNHEVGTIFLDPGAIASDNIDGDISANIGVTGSVDANTVGAYILSYNVSDAAGNAATTVNRTVNVADTGAPTITMSGANPLNHELNTIYTDPGATASDVVDDDATLSAAIVTINNVNENVAGTYTVTYDVTDSGGNPAVQQVRTVNVGDFTAPMITLIGNTTVNIELGSSYTDAGASATDNIDGDLSSSIISSGTVNPLATGTYVISYDVSDAAGNNAVQLTRTVIVTDTTAPVITLLGSASINHEQGTAYSDPGASATDNTDGDITASITVSGFVDANAAGTYTLNYNVSDSAGNNATTLTRTITVVDTTLPVLTLSGSTPTNHEQGTSYTDAGASASDTVDGDLTANILVTGSVDANTAGSYILTYNVSDTAGNAATSITRTVIVADTTAPAITIIGSSVVNHQQGSTYTDAGATASDLIDGDMSASIVVTGSVYVNVEGSYIISYDVTDAAGNAATTATRAVNVGDTIAPTIALLGNAIENHEQGTSYTDAGASANDNFDGDISANIVVSGTVDVNAPDTYILSYDVNDAAGNAAATVNRSVVIADTTVPVITINGNSNETVEQATSYTDAGATASDNVDGNLSSNIIVSGDTVDINTAGIYTTRYDVSDTAGNNAVQVTRTVTVEDSTAPLITLLGSSPLNHVQLTPYTDAGATASDSADGDITASITRTGDVDTNIIGTYLISYDVSDAAGNAATTVSRTVNVTDGIAPTITLLGNTIVNHEQSTSYTDAGATADDNLDGDVTTNIVLSGAVDVNTPGTYVLSYDVNDAAGNAATTVTRTVIIADTTIPVITLTGNAAETVEQGTSYTDAGATANDNVDGNLTSSIVISGDTVDANIAGIYTIRYDVSDTAGNAALQLSRTITVQDTTIPVITLTGSDPTNHVQGTAYNDAGATALDSADGDISGNIARTGSVDIDTIGSYVLSYNVSDAAGNAAATVTRTVNVTDGIAPVITLVGDSTIDHVNGQLFTDPGTIGSDNLDGDISLNITTGGFVDINTDGTYVLSYDLVDAAGNAAITVQRTINVVTPAAIFVEAETGTIGGGPDVESYGSGFTGSGYINISLAQDGDYIEFSDIQAFAIPYNLTIRYASSNDSSSFDILVNGSAAGSIALSATGDNALYLDSAALPVTLVSGANTLRFNILVDPTDKRIDSFTLTPQ
ncbi:S-layer family protein, partial [Oleiphilus sp. HI0123]